MKNTICVTLLIWSICVGIGFAITCYECQEELGKNLACEVNIATVLTPNCTEGFECIKYIWTNNATSIVYRGCGPTSKCEELQATATSNRTLDFCKTCSTPLCNSSFRADSITSTILSVIISFVSFTVFVKL